MISGVDMQRICDVLAAVTGLLRKQAIGHRLRSRITWTNAKWNGIELQQRTVASLQLNVPSDSEGESCDEGI
jgi:hypothetical protein